MKKRNLENLTLGEILKMRKGYCKDEQGNWKCNYCPLSVKPYCTILVVWNNLEDILECNFNEETGEPEFDEAKLNKLTEN